MTISYVGPYAKTPRTSSSSVGGPTVSKIAYRFTSDDPSDDEFDVGSHPSCPVHGSTHPGNAGSWCNGLEITNDEPYAGWLVTATYSTLREITTNPTSEPAVITWDGDVYQEPVVVDNTGQPVLNSAGDPYDPPVMQDKMRLSVSIRKNVASVPAYVLSYQDAINDDAITIGGLSISAFKAKLKKISIGEKQTRNGVDYYELSLNIHLNPKGWKVPILDAGFRRVWIIGGVPKRELIQFANESGDLEYPVAPVPLDGSGFDITDPTPANAVYIEYDIYTELPFASLPLS